MTEERKRRVSITKVQRQTAAGTDLIALCQTVTEDGRLVDEEVAALRQWLVDNHDIDLPARNFLRETVERIIADGKITADERQEMYQAIEAILPPDVRGLVRDKRRTVERDAKERARADREASRRVVQQERELNAPLESWDFMVAGPRFEGRPVVISQCAKSGDLAYLVRDPRNKYSRNAVEVRLANGMQIGFVPEDDAVDMAQYLDQGSPHEAYIKKILGGGRSPIPVIVASVYRAGSTRAGVVLQSQVPARVVPGPAFLGTSTQADSQSKRTGCAGMLTLIGVVMMILGAVVWWGRGLT